VVLSEPLPFLRLRGQDEVDHVARQQAERAVVVLGTAPAVAARRRLAEQRGRLAYAGRVPGACVRPVREQAALDRLLERPFGDLGAQGLDVPSFSVAR
jgi:hypothetical protein